MSCSLQPCGLQDTRLPCPSLSPRVCSDSCPLSWWCHPTISSSVVPFSFCLQSFPASGPFTVSRLFTSGGQSIRAPASASVLPMNVQSWFSLGLTGLILLAVQGTLKVGGINSLVLSLCIPMYLLSSFNILSAFYADIVSFCFKKLRHQFIIFHLTNDRLPGWLSGKEPACQCRRHERLEFCSWVGKIPWRRKWQPILVFLPGKFHEQTGAWQVIVCIVAESQTWLTIAHMLKNDSCTLEWLNLKKKDI